MDKMKKYETVLTKDYSNMVKGMAVLMMIMHHLWGFPEKIPALHLSNLEVYASTFPHCHLRSIEYLWRESKQSQR